MPSKLKEFMVTGLVSGDVPNRRRAKNASIRIDIVRIGNGPTMNKATFLYRIPKSPEWTWPDNEAEICSKSFPKMTLLVLREQPC